MKNDCIFDELEMLNLFKKTIKEAFEKDDNFEEDYWYNLFGQREMTIYDSYTVSKPTFPCCVITLSATPTIRNIHSSQIEQFSTVIARIEHYNQSVGDNNRETIGIKINQRIKYILQKTFGVLIPNNTSLSSPDSSIYRRLIEARFVYDNINKVFYREQ